MSVTVKIICPATVALLVSVNVLFAIVTTGGVSSFRIVAVAEFGPEITAFVTAPMRTSNVSVARSSRRP